MAVLRINIILMRIRILDPHWKTMDPDPDPGHFLKKFFFCSFWLIFYPLDPDPWICIFLQIRDPESQNRANPTDPDLKQYFEERVK